MGMENHAFLNVFDTVPVVFSLLCKKSTSLKNTFWNNARHSMPRSFSPLRNAIIIGVRGVTAGLGLRRYSCVHRTGVFS